MPRSEKRHFYTASTEADRQVLAMRQAFLDEMSGRKPAIVTDLKEVVARV